MTNPNQDVQAILREIVNDLEKTSAGLTYIAAEVQKLAPSSMASQMDGLNPANQAHRKFYDGLRQQIDALSSPSQE